MSFSLRWLFVVIAISAIFSAAIIYRTPFWTLTAVNLTVIILFVGSLGLWFQRLNQTFWMPFCAVGWFYFVSHLFRKVHTAYMRSCRVRNLRTRSTRWNWQYATVLRQHNESGRQEFTICSTY